MSRPRQKFVAMEQPQPPAPPPPPRTSKEKEKEKDKDLDKVLPKLAKRISSSHPSSSSPSASASSSPNERRQPSSSSSNSHSAESPPPPPPKSTPASSSTNGSAQPPARPLRNRKGSITFKPTVELPPEVEELRNRDISPDIDSAADRALNIAASVAQLNNPTSTAGGTAAPSKRGSVHESEPEKKVEGREIQQDHEQYALTYGMMLGIRVCTGRRDVNLDQLSSSKSLSSLLEEQELTESDYNTMHELVFLPDGNPNPPYPTPPHKLHFTFTFKDYMPNVFRAVRSLSNIEEADYMMSLAGDFNYIEFIANSKSGQFFFYSHDGKYMIKTQSREECSLLRKIMPDYVKHLTENPDSLLVRFYGMHRVKMKNLQSKTYFVIMSSVFDTQKSIGLKYDLKGSTVGRITSPEQCREGAVQKDLNLMQSGRKFRLGPENIDIFYNTLKADVTFLRDQNIMDYSLLVGVHDGKTSKPQRRASGVVLSRVRALQSGNAVNHNNSNNSPVDKRPSRGSSGDPGKIAITNPITGNGAGTNDLVASIFQSYFGGIKSSPDVNEIYFLGIIDILQLYNTSKRMENFFKGFSEDRKQLSAVSPALYAERMLDFIMLHTDYPEIMAHRKQQQRAAVSSARR